MFRIVRLVTRELPIAGALEVAPWLLSAALLLMGSQYGLAQSRAVSGVVVDADTGQPIHGALVRRGVLTTTTDADGLFGLQSAPGATLVISSSGYLPARVAVEQGTTVHVALEIDAGRLEQVLIMGYGEQRATAAAQRINAANSNVGLTSAPEQLVIGRVPGLSILQSGGEPGAPITAHLRGLTSISSSNAPLYVVDGIPIDNLNSIPAGIDIVDSGRKNPLVFLSPHDIASIDVLRDAGAAALYGGRGANGVILINTRDGQTGDLRINYHALAGASEFIRPLPLVSARDYQRFVRTNGLSPGYIGGSETDWQDAVTRTAMSHSHHLAASGGVHRTRYRVSGGYLSQEGVLNGSGLERLSGNLHLRHRGQEGRLGADIRLLGSTVRDDRVPVSHTGGYHGGLLLNVVRFNPTHPVYNEDGSFFESEDAPGVFNPVALAEQVDDIATSRRVIGSLRTDYMITPELSLAARFGMDRHRSERDVSIARESPILEFDVPARRQAENSLGSSLGEAMARYARLEADSHLHIIAGYSMQAFFRDGFGPSIHDLALSAIPDVRWSHRQHALFTRIHYLLRDRYAVTISLRRESSSRFGDDLEYALFPSVALGWRIGNGRTVDNRHDIRLRASYGLSGTQDFEPVAFYGTWGRWPAGDPHAGLSWEKTSQLNLGIDYAFWQGRMNGAVDLYRKSTTDMLLEVARPLDENNPTQLVNGGRMQNLGIEVLVEGQVFAGPRVSVDAGGMLHGNRNRVKKLGGWPILFTGFASGPGLSVTPSQVVMPGHSLGTFQAPAFAGYDVSGTEQCLLNSGAAVDCLLVPPSDWRNVGTALPDFEYGLWASVGLNRWDFRVLMRGAAGLHVFNNLGLAFSSKHLGALGMNFLRDALDDPVPITEVTQYSSRWVQNASFFRLDSIELGYTFRSAAAAQVFLRAVRVFTAVNNVFLITPYSGWDPEVSTESHNTVGIVPIVSSGIDYTNYPRPRTYTIGIHLEL